ncbi:hypothetical protein L1887_42469 [Cichorium endivia]|nr:hypothetical protein L1887_42469 [Cichorium endivia]
MGWASECRAAGGIKLCATAGRRQSGWRRCAGSKGRGKRERGRGRSRVCLSARGCARACVCAHACGCRSRSRRVLECRGAAASSQSRAAKKARRRRKVHGGGAALLTLSLNHAKEQQRAGDGMHIQTRVNSSLQSHARMGWSPPLRTLTPASEAEASAKRAFFWATTR